MRQPGNVKLASRLLSQLSIGLHFEDDGSAAEWRGDGGNW